MPPVQTKEIKEVAAFRSPIAAESAEDLGFRQFVVTDVQAVEVPGCLEIEEVRLNGAQIPPFEDHSVPVDGTHKNFQTLRVGNYALVPGPKGEPILLRGLNSNDGHWQLGSTVAVKGKWEEKAKK